MTVAQFITILRRKFRDLPILTRDTFDGDATTTAFRTRYTPILEGEFTVKIGGTPKVENTDYTLDRDTGLITFTSAPASGNDNVTIDYKYVVLSDTEYLEIINNVIREWREKIWVEAIDETTLTTVAKKDDYDLDAIDSNIFKVLAAYFRTNSNNDWVDITRDTNVRYMKEQNILNFRPYFDRDDYEIRVRYLTFYAEYTATTDTFIIPTRYHQAFQYFAHVEYFDYFMAIMVNDLGAKTQSNTYKSLDSVSRLRDKMAKKAEVALIRSRPRMPSSNIATIHLGIKS